MARFTFGFVENENRKSSTGSFTVPNDVTHTKLFDPAGTAGIIKALEALTEGVNSSASLKLDITGYVPNSGTPTVLAQRGQKFLVTGLGANGKKYSFTIPTAKGGLQPVGSDYVDLAQTQVAALITALDTVWVDEAGTKVTPTSVRYVNHHVN